MESLSNTPSIILLFLVKSDNSGTAINTILTAGSSIPNPHNHYHNFGFQPGLADLRF